MRFLDSILNVLILLSIASTHYNDDADNDDEADSPIFFSNRLKFFKPSLTDSYPKIFHENDTWGDDGGDDGGGGEGGGGENEDGEDGDGGGGDGGENGGGDEFNGEFSEVRKTMTRVNQVVSCRDGSTLLSCGIDHTNHNNHHHNNHHHNNHHYSNHTYPSNNTDNDNFLTYAHPINNKTCACFLSETAITQGSKLKCQAWCHRGDLNTTINATNQILFRSMIASCPKESKVLGCHMQFSGGTHHKYSNFKRFFHPLEDGKGCFCKDFVGAKCISTCGFNIRGHLVVTSKINGDNKASCPDGYLVTGCGVKQSTRDDRKVKSGYPSAYVSSSDSCSCFFPSSSNSSFYSSYPSCYAVCVKINRFDRN